jgi:hypothetical protein
MSEERFDRIDRTLGELGRRSDGVDQTLSEFRQRFDEVDRTLGEFRQRFDRLETRMEIGFKELGREMRVLHEDVIGRSAGTREPPAVTREDLTQANDGIDRRLIPLEALPPVVRDHSAALQKHEAEIERLKRRRS